MVPIQEALERARDAGLDLVEVAPNANPPVCRILDYGKFKYEQAKKEREAHKHQKQVVLREVRFKPKIGVHHVDFKTKVVANTVSQEDNVRQVVSKVQLGEADAAVVYSTDATPQVRDQLQIIQVPDPLQTLATYPIAVARGNNPAGGEAFVAYVVGPQGQATLAKWGFLPPTQATAADQPTPAASGGAAPRDGA